MRKTFTIINLGCPRNIVDSEHIFSEFTDKGYTWQKDAGNADIVIINTCAFINEAKEESVDTILKVIDAKEKGLVEKIIVAGCLPQRYGKELKDELKGVNEFRGVMDFRTGFSDFPSVKLTPAHYAYIKISEGCKNRCSYCVIPYLKGPYRSRRIESIAAEARFLFNKGIREVILVGQDTSLYGIDLYSKKSILGLLKKLSKISKDSWIRILYMHPANLDREVIKFIGDTLNICKYIDLPIEHISDRILKRMGRKTRKSEIISLIEYLRKQIPGVAIRTSLIVGFPGETEKEFQELLSFIKDVRFERLGVFRYSREEGTPAYSYKNQVSEREKDRRFNEIMRLQQDISREINRNLKGRILRVLIDEKGEDYYTGRTEYDAPEVDGLVYVPSGRREGLSNGRKSEDLIIGNFYNVRIVDTYEYDLVGERIE